MYILLPGEINNKYDGLHIAKYALYPLCLVSTIRSLIHIICFDGGAQSIATIPLDQFSESANSVIIMMFALWGASQLLMAIVSTIILIKYQKCIPFVYFIYGFECLLRLLIFQMKPIVVTNYAPGGKTGSCIMLLYCITFFALSLIPNKKHKTNV